MAFDMTDQGGGGMAGAKRGVDADRQEPGPVLFTMREVCELLRCSEAVVHKLRKGRRLNGVQHEGSRRWLFAVGSVNAYLRGLGVRAKYLRPKRSRKERSAAELHRRVAAARARRGYKGPSKPAPRSNARPTPGVGPGS